MTAVTIDVDGYPPAKNEAKSMFSPGHSHESRVLALLKAANDSVGPTAEAVFPGERLRLDVVLYAPGRPPSDATNYLGGIADVLEAKQHRGTLPHLGSLTTVALYTNDSQIQEIHYSVEPDRKTHYTVRITALRQASAIE